MPIATASATDHDTLPGPLLLREVAEQLGAVLERERRLAEAARCTSAATAPTLRPLTSATTSRRAGDVLAANHVGRGHDRDRRRRRRAARDRPRGVDQQVAGSSATLWRTWGSPHTTTSNTFCSSNRLPTSMPGEQRRRRAAHVARLDAVASRPPRDSTSISTTGSLGFHLDVRIDDAVDAGESLLHLLGFAAQHVQLLAVDAHDDRLVDAARAPRRTATGDRS